MSDFTTILSRTVLASSPHGVKKNGIGIYQNIAATDILSRLAKPVVSEKDGSHILRGALIVSESGECLPRNDENTQSLANILILDGDSRITSTGEILDGAPDPYRVSQILRENNIGHVLYGSYSHYAGGKGHRYRIILTTSAPYTKKQLAPSVEAIIALINAQLDNDELLVDATENSTWAQPWYYPRKPANSALNDLYLEYLEGQPIMVTDPLELPPTSKYPKPSASIRQDQISPINAFNEQRQISHLLNQYGYKKVFTGKETEKWISPNSTSGHAGITVKDDKFFSHHGSCPFNDGYWHDAFDLMRLCEGLSEKEAIKRAAQSTLAPDGRTVNEYNKSQASRAASTPGGATTQPIPHSKILERLLSKIMPINFRKTAGIADEKEDLTSRHFHVIVVETILDLARQHNWGICRNHDFIYLYNGEYWSLMDADDLQGFLGTAAERMSVDKYFSRHFNFRDQLYKQFIASGHLPKPEQPKDIVFINLKNGTFEISPAGTRLKPFDRADFISYQLPFKYDPDAVAPLFNQYLDRVLPDKKLQDILAEYLGYVFIRPSTLKLEKTLLLFGSGANGKSVLYEIARSLFGEQNTSEYSLQSLTNESGYFRAMISHKLLNYASEINGKLQTSIFKQLVSGEPVEARLPYGTPFTMTNYAKLIFNCNDLPKDVEQSEAFFRRFLIIPFNVTIPESEQDKQLAKKIIDSELSGVFNWVLAGLKRLLSQKQFTYSDVVCRARDQYEKESDTVRLFLDEMRYKPTTIGCVLIKTLYFEYRGFCLENGNKPLSCLNFRKRLENAKIVVSRKNYGNVAFVSRSQGENPDSQ